MRYPGIIGGSYTVSIAAQERTVNFVVEPVKSQGRKNDAILLPTPGDAIFSAQSTTSLSSPGRALEEHAGRAFAVIGDEFVEILVGGQRTVWGTVGVDEKPATISYNGDGGRQLLITSAGAAYLFNLDTSAFTTITGPWAYASNAAMVDGYLFVLDGTTSTMWQSDLLDGSTFNGLNFAQRSAAPDPWVRIVAHDRQLWMLGTQTSEAWFNNRAYPFAFEPHPSGLIKFGTSAPYSAVSLGDKLIWLARTKHGDSQVVITQGFQSQVVSDYALEAVIRDYPLVEDAIGFAYQMGGHEFYILTFPSANATWALDLGTGQWTERGTWIPSQNQYAAWRPTFHCLAHGQHLTVDYAGGDVLAISDDYGTHANGSAIRRLRRAPSLAVEGRMVTFDRLQLHLKTGIGLNSGQGSNPLIELCYSDDGGDTWTSAGKRPAGRMGKRDTVVEWNRLGSSTDRVFEFVVSDPVPWCFIDAYLDMRAGNR